MFGIFRTLLALMVVAGHLFGPPELGVYAVFGFYTLSGYLMTFIINRNYGHTTEGIKAYFLNRILRIYPMYYCAIILSILILFLLGSDITTFKQEIQVPSTLRDWFQNIFLFFPTGTKVRLSPPSWALTIELFFYILIGLGLSKTKLRTLLWFLIGIIYTVFSLATDAPWRDRYSVIWAASLPFSIGALIYYYESKLIQSLNKMKLNKPILWFSLILLNFLFFLFLKHFSNYNGLLHYGFYLNLAFTSLCIISLIKSNIHLTKRIDNWVGQFSYPIYLIHIQIGAVIFVLINRYSSYQYSNIIEMGIVQRIIFLFVSIVFTLLISYSMLKVIDGPINRLRELIKHKYIDINN